MNLHNASLKENGVKRTIAHKELLICGNAIWITKFNRCSSESTTLATLCEPVDENNFLDSILKVNCALSQCEVLQIKEPKIFVYSSS